MKLTASEKALILDKILLDPEVPDTVIDKIRVLMVYLVRLKIEYKNAKSDKISRKTDKELRKIKVNDFKNNISYFIEI